MSFFKQLKNVLGQLWKSLDYGWYTFKQNKLTVAGLVMLGVLFFIAIFSPLISPYQPDITDASNVLTAPSLKHFFGTDQWGRDVFSRTVWATRIDLFIALTTVLISAVAGSIIGAFSGYFGGKVDELLMRLTDIFLAFPSIILALGIMVSLGSGLWNLMLTQIIIRFPIFIRTSRGEILSVKENEYAQAAVCVGNSTSRIVVRHLLPNCLTPIGVMTTLNFGMGILVTATLSFLGLGLNPPTAEWGLMISDGAGYLVTGSWWLSIPGVFIVLAVLGFNLLGDGLRDLM
jgi:peptide/nickel transport system permease protein